MQGGALSVAEVSATTGLNADLVRASIEHLTRLGLVESSVLASGCPGGGCGSCASGHADGSAGCGASGPSSARRGPVLVQLSLRPPVGE